MPRNSSRTDSTVANLSDDALFDKLVSSDSVEEFSDTGVVVKLLRLLITKQDSTAKNVQKTLTTVASKTNKNATQLSKLKSMVTNMDQHSGCISRQSEQNNSSRAATSRSIFYSIPWMMSGKINHIIAIILGSFASFHIMCDVFYCYFPDL